MSKPSSRKSPPQKSKLTIFIGEVTIDASGSQEEIQEQIAAAFSPVREILQKVFGGLADAPPAIEPTEAGEVKR